MKCGALLLDCGRHQPQGMPMPQCCMSALMAYLLPCCALLHVCCHAGMALWCSCLVVCHAVTFCTAPGRHRYCRYLVLTHANILAVSISGLWTSNRALHNDAWVKMCGMVGGHILHQALACPDILSSGKVHRCMRSCWLVTSQLNASTVFCARFPLGIGRPP